jgi:hypothetical protein
MSIIKGIKNAYKFLTEDNSKDWSKRQYNFYLFFGDSIDQHLPWNYEMWNEQIEPLIDKILVKSTEYKNTGIRVLKYQKKPNSEYFQDLKLGKLRWDKKSHEKWTIQSESDIYFKHFELWTPIWTKCEKSNSAPDIFIIIENENDYIKNRDRQFNVFVVLAIATDLKVDCNDIIIELSKKLNSKKTVSHIRKWSEGKKDINKNWKFYNWIQDTYINGIYRKKSLHDFNFTEIVFEPYWEMIYKEKY